MSSRRPSSPPPRSTDPLVVDQSTPKAASTLVHTPYDVGVSATDPIRTPTSASTPISSQAAPASTSSTTSQPASLTSSSVLASATPTVTTSTDQYVWSPFKPRQSWDGGAPLRVLPPIPPASAPRPPPLHSHSHTHPAPHAHPQSTPQTRLVMSSVASDSPNNTTTSRPVSGSGSVSGAGSGLDTGASSAVSYKGNDDHSDTSRSASLNTTLDPSSMIVTFARAEDESSPEGEHVAFEAHSGSRIASNVTLTASGAVKGARVGVKRRRGEIDPGAIEGQYYGDKTCNRCRERRVRCDRAFPICGRCLKRREGCSYPDQTSARKRDDPEELDRVAALEAAVATVEQELEAQRHDNRPDTKQTPSEASSASSRTFPTPAPPVPPDDRNREASLELVTSIHSALHPNLSLEESCALLKFLVEERLGLANIGPFSIEHRLGLPSAAKALTISLMHAGQKACCSRLPALHALARRIPEYQANLHDLDPASQLGVAVLCALGARTSPHSALLGISTTALSDGTATPAMYLGAGERREKACRALEARAKEICWAGNVLSEPAWDNLESLAGLTQLLIFEEAQPKESRFVLRNAVGIFVDLMNSDAEDAGHERIKRLSTSLFADDAMTAPRAMWPCLISTEEMRSYFEPVGAALPNFVEQRLGSELDQILQQPLTRTVLESTLTTIGLWVCGVQRLFARLAIDRRPNTPSPFQEFRALYALIDETHAGIQKLQHFLVNVHVPPPGCEDEPYALDHFVLLGVRADTYLVDAINLVHQALHTDARATWSTTRRDNTFLASLRHEAELRVRKSLKLVAFYSQLFLQSNDKHLVYHLVVQLETLPAWTEMAAQRVELAGVVNSTEYELNEQELDWLVPQAPSYFQHDQSSDSRDARSCRLREGLELACYFTPRAGTRLRQLTEARRRLRPGTTSYGNPMQRHSPADPRPSTNYGLEMQFPYATSGIASMHQSASETNVGPQQSSAQVYSPYIFDTYGFVSNRDPNLPTHLVPCLPDEPTSNVVDAFQGQSWNDVNLTDQWAALDQGGKEEGEDWMWQVQADGSGLN
ncbi:BQ2448_2226 [Microbotryum intermedium]|uniref:BQ2448_2226 protein n=1 Tax=Microbotryum intermedium TaxID=269621 RepID=A0A238FDN9_9BASI|nr:BQ2448_2226 [Microbotryum intermedium]